VGYFAKIGRVTDALNGGVTYYIFTILSEGEKTINSIPCWWAVSMECMCPISISIV